MELQASPFLDAGHGMLVPRDARAQPYERALLQLGNRMRPPQRRMTAARHRHERVLEERELAKPSATRAPANRWRRRSSLRASPRSISIGRDRVEKAISTFGAAWASRSREPHRDRSGPAGARRRRRSAAGGPRIEVPRFGDRIAHRAERVAQLAVDQVRDRRRDDALGLPDEELVARTSTAAASSHGSRPTASSRAVAPPATGCAPRRRPRTRAAG